MKKNMNVVLNFVLLCMLVILFASCSGSGDDNASPKEITAFSLGEYVGTIKGKTIEVTMPFGTNVTALVATFTTTGASVKVGSTVQVNGTTANDFSYPVVYTVIGDDDSTTTYTVTVTVAPSSAKAITSFTLGGFVGIINEAEKTIAVSAKLDTDVKAMVATFATTGESVKVGSIVQTTGVTPNDFTSAVVYTVTAADSSTTTYTVIVTLKNQPASDVRVSMKPNSPSSVPIGVYCTKTTSITGTINITDMDGDTDIEWKWYDNGSLRSSGTATLSEANGTTTTILAAPFGYHHTIKLEVTADGVVTNSISALITCGAVY